jgi:hypothetical protein
MTDESTPAAAAPVVADAPAPTSSAPAPTLLDADPQSSTTPAIEGEGAAAAAVDADKEPKQSEDAPKGAPAEYENFALPDGRTLDPVMDTDLKTLAKELDLTQAGAQKLAELGAKAATKWSTDLQSHIDATSDAWEQAAKADKDIGGDKLPANLGLAKSALDRFGTPELRELLNTSRLGNHPDMIRLLAKVGQATSDDSRLTTGIPPNAPGAKSPASVMFPNQQ